MIFGRKGIDAQKSWSESEKDVILHALKKGGNLLNWIKQQTTKNGLLKLKDSKRQQGKRQQEMVRRRRRRTNPGPFGLTGCHDSAWQKEGMLYSPQRLW